MRKFFIKRKIHVSVIIELFIINLISWNSPIVVLFAIVGIMDDVGNVGNMLLIDGWIDVCDWLIGIDELIDWLIDIDCEGFIDIEGDFIDWLTVLVDTRLIEGDRMNEECGTMGDDEGSTIISCLKLEYKFWK